MHEGQRRAIHAALVRLSNGDRSAFPELLDALWPVLLAFARRGLQHEQDAEDVAQEVFLKICSRISDFDPHRDGLSWAFGIASYEVLTLRRRRQRRRESLEDPKVFSLTDSAASQEEALLQVELEAALEHALGKLSDHDRLLLGVGGGTTALAVTGATLRKRKQRALERLRGVWRRLHGEY